MLRSLLRVQNYFKGLTKQQAAKRAELIKHNSINYGFYLNLHPDPNRTYDGFAEISFELTKNLHHNELFLDFQGKTIKDIYVNNHKISENAYIESEGKIYIPFELLNKKDKQNYVTVRYLNNYDKDGSGCVSFTDVDSMQYLYTQFEPYMANRVFPLFDQPDLKACMQLSVSCPKSWQTVISNEFVKQQFDQVEKKVDFNHLVHQVLANSKYINNYNRQQLKQFIRDVPPDYHTTIFNHTKLLSTYLYCFVVGPYKKFPILQTYRSIPMNLYCIQSLYPSLIKLQPFISQITNRSMQFFQHYFHYPYPFSKYDQIFAHEYKWGAMENAGIVTFNDQYLFKQDVSIERKLALANTISHELAHHWFGNLVTMKWWDDLWLNQSFAQYISHYCLENIKDQVETLKYQSAMTAFYGRKAWGYAEDKLETTHPIRGEVHNTSQAQSIFDGITYAKGAATMKQLMFLIGQENFSKALRQYFHQFQYKNAVLDDLLNHLNRVGSSHLPTTMDIWKKTWLQSAGLNQIECFWSPSQYEKSKEIMIKQTPYSVKFPTLRTHTIQIAFIYEEQPGKLKVKHLQTTLKAEQYSRIKCQLPTPKAIFLNYRDLSFVKTIIDENSLKFLQNNLKYLRNCEDGLLLSTMIWRNFYEMVTQANISSKQYVDLCLKNLLHEKTDSIVEQQLSLIFEAIRAYTPGAYRQKMFDQVFSTCYDELIRFSYLSANQQKQWENRILILKNKIINFADSQQSKKKLLNWMNGETQQLKQEPFQLKGKQQWRTLAKVFTMKSLKQSQKWELFQYQKLNDNSDDMVNFKYVLQALLARPEQMKTLYQEYLNPNTGLSITYLTSSMSGFNHSIHYDEIAKHYLIPYFNDLVQACKNLHSSQAQLFLTNMDPIIDHKHSDISIKIYEFKRISQQIKDFKLHRIVKKKIQTLQRRNKAYEKFESTL